ncbi:MAG TPA: sulfite exporter TauE/SafE family protein [Bacteroidia bacterium]|jgi:hypothetical protein|nr:sulfite exporter TauE/SafE family protein [Bacteroidia bacterium]
MFLLAAISLGFLGSFHCVGMCGPIALSIPVKRTSSFSIIAGSLIYNAGRIVTYSLMGLLFGLLGKGFVMAGWQNVLSILLGILILIIAFLPGILSRITNTGSFLRLLEKLRSYLRKLFGIHSVRSLFFIGLINGLLPCGLVYLAIAGSIATGNALQGALFMATFGLGTFPAMLVLTVIKDFINIKAREKIQKIIPVFVTIMAVLLILRGMNLNIPYVSPSLKVNSKGVCEHQCCKK